MFFLTFLDNSGIQNLNTSDPNYKKSTYNPREDNKTYHRPKNSKPNAAGGGGKSHNSSNISNLRKSNISKAKERKEFAQNMADAEKELKRKQVKSLNNEKSKI